MRSWSVSNSSRSTPIERHEELAVEHAALGQLLPDRRDDLGEVAGQRLGVAAGQLDLVAVAEDDAAEAVPLGLEAQAAVELGRVRDPLDRLRQHRLHGRHHGQVHAADASRWVYCTRLVCRGRVLPRGRARPGSIPGWSAGRARLTLNQD